jgi:Ca-activated chloride channel family protein
MHLSGKWAVAVGAMWLAACGNSGMYAGVSGGAGARTGGATDWNLARSKVASGQVPTPEDFPAEGLFAQHDMPIAGAACTDTFCAQLGVALAPDVALSPDGGLGTAGYVQVGLASNIDLATLHRAPLNAAVVIDRSGSMAGGKLDAVKTAAMALVDKLGPDDLLTIVRFDSASEVVQEPVAVTNPAALKQVISNITVGGSTCIECGLRDGFNRLARHNDATRSSRLFLFTDEQPNVQGTTPGDFLPLLTQNGEAGIGITTFGVGLDFGQAIAEQISAVRGANYAYLDSPEHIAAVFDQDFDALVTPVAYDLTLELTPETGTTLQTVYGIPGGDTTTVKTTVKTVFLSRTRGAIVARLSAVPAGTRLGSLAVSYSTPSGDARSSQADAVTPSGAAPSYSCDGTHVAVVLTRLVAGAREACRLFHAGDEVGAKAEAARVAAFMDTEATATGEAGLRTEADFAAALAKVIAPTP